jgi:hypothetical protein
MARFFAASGCPFRKILINDKKNWFGNICPVFRSDLYVIVYMILKECIMIYEMGYEISAGNHGRMHPNSMHERGLCCE